MASTYTNSGIEKIGSGEQAGTWGNTTNNNLDIIDKAINGVQALTLSGTTDTFTVTDGTVSDAGARVLVLGGSPSGEHTLTLAPNDADKVHLVKNGTSQTVNITQGSGGNAVLTAGEVSWIFCDGAGSGAAVTKQDFSSTPGDFSVGDDLSLASDSAVINFGADSEIKITHVADTGLNIKHTATGDDKPIVLTLQTGETDIQGNDVIGAINFQAPDEGTGTDAILVAAGIEAVSEGNFAADNNATKLSFKTGSSEEAAEKMSLSSAGNLSVSGGVTITGDLTVSGDDITMGTNTSGHIMVADGTNFNPVAVSGDVTIAANGAVTIANNAVETAMIADGQVSAAKLTSGTGVCNASCTVNNGGGTVSASSNNTNIAGTVDNGVGDVSVTFTSAMSGTDYAAIVSAIDDDGTNRNIGETIVHARSTTASQLKTFRPSASENSARAAFDNDAIGFAAFD
tara:strand:- start:965 stop:2332 length:1368 start_codon:yes stop_codon:yes gene_type:complete